MPKDKTKTKTESVKNLRVNIKGLYDTAEAQSDFNSVNKQYRTSTFIGVFVSIEKFSGKYGETFRYNFETENQDKWSLLSSSKILNSVCLEIPIFTKVEVFKNEKGHWRILPYLE